MKLARDPLSADDILTGFYRPSLPLQIGLDPDATEEMEPDTEIGTTIDAADTAVHTGKKPKPSHYKIVCISLYLEDIERLDRLVAELKRRGHSKANKSQLIRAALLQIDLDRVPKAL